ncbi:MAG: hypothetical protein ACJA02_001079 [Myxococcota bacterium]|jgi:hypothetical protein
MIYDEKDEGQIWNYRWDLVLGSVEILLPKKLEQENLGSVDIVLKNLDSDNKNSFFIS